MIFKKQPKKVISLTEFIEAIQKVAKELNEEHFHVSIDYSPFGFEHELGHTKGLVLKAYIHNHTWHSGFTIEEVCEKFRKKPEIISPIEEVIVTEENIIK